MNKDSDVTIVNNIRGTSYRYLTVFELFIRSGFLLKTATYSDESIFWYNKKNNGAVNKQQKIESSVMEFC